MEVYEANHIPGAVAWDYQNDYFSPERGDLVEKATFEKQLSWSGILPETTIVLYGGLHNMSGGTIQLPTTRPDGTFSTIEELEVLFESLGITREKDIVTYCLLGGASTHAWFVLTQLLGYPNVREYDRSRAEWGNLENTPVEL